MPHHLSAMTQSTTPSSPVLQVLQARQEATSNQVEMALARKQLDAHQQAGDAINDLLRQAVEMQRQLADGHLDVRV